MKTTIQFFGFLILILFTFFSCEKWDREEKDFIAVEFSKIDVLSLTAVKLTGEIKDLKIGQVSDHGFVWTTESTLPTLFENEGASSLGIKDNVDAPIFSAGLDGFDPDTRYTFVAYAVLGKSTLYSESMTWNSGQGMVFTDSLSYSGKRSFQIFGRISGTEAGLTAINHGFCWSAQNEIPTLEDEFENLGVQRSDLPFSGEVDSLKMNLTYYLRAFAVMRHPTTFALDTLYGEILKFDEDLYDIWIQRQSLPTPSSQSFFGSIAFSTSNAAFFHVATEPTMNFWKYDAQNDDWKEKKDFGGIAREGAVGFSINDKCYIGTGVDGPNGNVLNDFWEYDPVTDNWMQKADFEGGVRLNAVGLSINNIGYIGLGWNFFGSEFNDFWAYDQEANIWTRKTDFTGGYRRNAVGFSIEDKGYIGTGDMGFFSLVKDFWEYDPVTDDWTQKADFGGEARFSAVGFSTQDKGYIGMGNFDFQLPLNDFWEYDPTEDSWIRRSDFPVPNAEGWSAFSVGRSAYVGRTDFWEYIPQ